MIDISPIELHQKLQQEKIFLLDVREVYEREDFNIGGKLIPLGELMGRASEIPMNETVVVYCKKGVRSQLAIQRLDKLGFSNLINLKGGIEAWKREIERG